MKIRNGFVSNSSSSSFVVILKEEDYNKIIDNMTEFERAAVGYIGPQKRKLFGQNVVYMSWMSGNCGTFDGVDLDKFPKSKLDDIDNSDLYNMAYNALDILYAEASKLDAFAHTQYDS